jgi:hypothetical protein
LNTDNVLTGIIIESKDGILRFDGATWKKMSWS